MPATSNALSTPQNHYPSFLYLRGRIFYYRHRMPQKFVASGSPKEIRVCLRTSYQITARKLAAHLHALTEQLLENWQMNESNNTPDRHAQIDALRAILREEVNAILSSSPKSPINIQELQKRLNAYLRQKLDEDLSCADLPPVAEFHAPDKPVETITIADACQDVANRIQSEILSGENYDTNYHNAIMGLIQLGVLEPYEITEENAQAIVKAFMVMQVKLNKILAARYNGDYALEQQLCPQTQSLQEICHPQESCKQASIKSIFLDELIEKYIQTNISDGKWEKRTIADHRNRVSCLLDILGNKPVDQISREEIRLCRDTLRKLPPRWKVFISKNNASLSDIIENAKDKDKLSIKTVNINIEAISSMFTWAIAEGIISSNPAKNLALKDNQPVIDKKQPLSEEDIHKLFFSPEYSLNNFKKPSFYWVPLIALYTGMRLEEICQLHCEDIYEEGGIWIIDIRKESNDGLHDKIIKTNNAIRKIPIHQSLIDRGFLEYLRQMKNDKSIRLFPELNKTERSPKYGKQVGKSFSNLLKTNGIMGGKSFHSIRHSFSDFFKKRNMHTDMFRQVFGHEIPHLAGKQYGGRFSPKEIYDEMISKIDYK